MFPPRKLGHQITLLAISGIVLLAVVLLTFNLFENRQRAVTAEQGALQTELQNIESVIRNASHETVLAATLIAQRPDAAKAVADKAKRLAPVIEKVEARRAASNAPVFDEKYSFGGLPTGRSGTWSGSTPLICSRARMASVIRSA